jgi:VHL beta domain
LNRYTFYACTLALTILAASAIAAPNSEIKLQSCKLEAKASSVASEVSANVELTNDLAGPVKIYWLDFDGRRQHYMDLAPGEALTQPTFARHWWLIVRNEGGQPCIGLFQAIAGNSRVKLSKSAR